MKSIEKSEELPWLLMLSVADYRKKKPDEELLSELEEWAMNKEQVREALIEWETLSANTEIENCMNQGKRVDGPT